MDILRILPIDCGACGGEAPHTVVDLDPATAFCNHCGEARPTGGVRNAPGP